MFGIFRDKSQDLVSGVATIAPPPRAQTMEEYLHDYRTKIVRTRFEEIDLNETRMSTWTQQNLDEEMLNEYAIKLREEADTLVEKNEQNHKQDVAEYALSARRFGDWLTLDVYRKPTWDFTGAEKDCKMTKSISLAEAQTISLAVGEPPNPDKATVMIATETNYYRSSSEYDPQNNNDHMTVTEMVPLQRGASYRRKFSDQYTAQWNTPNHVECRYSIKTLEGFPRQAIDSTLTFGETGVILHIPYSLERKVHEAILLAIGDYKP